MEVEYAPYRDLAHDVIFHLELLHLAIPNGTILALQEFLLDLVPGTDVFSFQGDLDSAHRNILSYAQRGGDAGSEERSTYWLLVKATRRGKSSVDAPLSFHIRRKKCSAKECTLGKLRKNGWNVVDVESAGAMRE